MFRYLAPIGLGPVYAAQLLAVALCAERLPEAGGPRAGIAGQGRPVRLLLLGDSSGAGVGVARQQDALIGQTLHHMTPHLRVEWQLIARSGATTHAARTMLRGLGQFDLAMLALGVNDTLRQTRTAQFRQAQMGLMQDLREGHGVGCILASAVPPLGAFPAFPEPLRGFLGRRAAMLDKALREVCDSTGAQHVPFDLIPSADLLARDGFHPGAKLYCHWGARMAQLALRALSGQGKAERTRP